MDLTRATSLDVEKPSWTFSKMPLNKLVNSRMRGDQGFAVIKTSEKVNKRGSQIAAFKAT